MIRNDVSSQLFEAAKQVIPGGVNSPVRSFASVGSSPVFAKRGQGPILYDEDGQAYIDYILSWGPLFFGHAQEEILEGVMDVLQNGSTYGVPTRSEGLLAKALCDLYPGLEMVRMVSSGTEATMSAIRLARGYTGRDKIIKFQGCYHGHSDGLLIQAGSGALTQGVPTSKGVPQSILSETLVASYNDLDQVTKLLEAYPHQVAAIIVEPVAANMGLVGPREGFLSGLRSLCNQHGTLLIFDEVITGFRLSLGGASAYYQVTPDLVCFGKMIGGGMPVGAYGGPKEIMSQIAPLGPVYQAGTLSGNPVAMKMGLNVIQNLIKDISCYEVMTQKAIRLESGFRKNLDQLGIKNVTINRVGSLLCQFFTQGPVTNYEEVMRSDTTLYERFFKGMLDQGILLPPSQYECLFLSMAHTDQHLDATILAHYQVMAQLK